MNTKIPVTVFFLLFAVLGVRAQLTFGFSNEIGVVVGPVLFQSDYGQRQDFSTNVNNSGLGIGLVHFINFAYRADTRSYTRDVYFNDHFKIRNELDYHYTKFTHGGKESKKDSDEGRDLRDHTGTSSVFELGSQIEFYPLSIRDFEFGAYRITPYVSVGIHYVYYKPGYGSVQDVPSAPPEDVYFDRFLMGDGKLGGIDDTAGSTYAITASLGLRYKIGILSDINVELRYHGYGSDWVDGLNPGQASYTANKYDDSIVWLTVGYVYYLNF